MAWRPVVVAFAVPARLVSRQRRVKQSDASQLVGTVRRQEVRKNYRYKYSKQSRSNLYQDQSGRSKELDRERSVLSLGVALLDVSLDDVFDRLLVLFVIFVASCGWRSWDCRQGID